MRRIISLMGAVGLGALSAAACSDDAEVIPRPAGGTGGSAGASAAGRGGLAGRGGSSPGTGGSSAGSAGSSVAGGAAGTGGASAVFDAGASVDAGPIFVDAGDAGVLIRCDSPSDCNDDNACTNQACVAGTCAFTPVSIGAACGDTATSDECTAPDTCDGNGVCLPNHQPDGTLCASGHCNLTGVCDCAVERVTTVPYGQQWQTTADTEVDSFDDCQLCDNAADHIVVFTAVVPGTYRFTATAGGDAELAVFEGDCASTPLNLECGTDIDAGNDDFSDRLELALGAGVTVTVVVAESCDENGGNGTLGIELLPGG